MHCQKHTFFFNKQEYKAYLFQNQNNQKNKLNITKNNIVKNSKRFKLRKQHIYQSFAKVYLYMDIFFHLSFILHIYLIQNLPYYLSHIFKKPSQFSSKENFDKLHAFVCNQLQNNLKQVIFFQDKQFLLLLHRIIFKNYPLVNQKSQFCLKVVQNYQLSHKELKIISNIVKYAQLLIFILKKRRKHIIRQQQSQTNKDYGPKTTCYDNEKIYNSFQKELELQKLRLQNLSLIKLTVNQALNQKLICNILQFQFMKRYSIITVEKRRQLIQKVIFNSESLKKTAKQLKIKLSTAKHILRIFRREGRIFQKRANLNSKIEQNIQIQQQSQKNQQLDENYQISQIIIPQIQNNEYLFTNNWFPFQSNFNFDFQNFWWYFPWTSM